MMGYHSPIAKPEAASFVCQDAEEYGFGKLGLSRLICLIERGNLASIRVAAKIGMTFEKEAQDEKGPFLLYKRNRELIIKSA